MFFKKKEKPAGFQAAGSALHISLESIL